MASVEPIRVALRVRPLGDDGLAGGGKDCVVLELESGGSGVVLRTPASVSRSQHYPRTHRFEFDRVFGPESAQSQVFEYVQPLVESVLEGYNSTLFANGVTGSGKTFTLMGGRSRLRANPNSESPLLGEALPETAGLIPRALQALFEGLRSSAPASSPDASFSVSMSYCELYNDRLKNLLSGYHLPTLGSPKVPFFVRVPRESSSALGSPAPTPMRYVYSRPDSETLLDCTNFQREDTEGGSLYLPIASAEEGLELLESSSQRRATRATSLNDQSSRSHSLLTVQVVQRSGGLRRAGKLRIVDLAGSENLGLTGASGDQMRETQSINRSLFSLGFLFNRLAEEPTSDSPASSSSPGFSPSHLYRSDKLTTVLRDSFGGNSKTLMITTVRQEPEFFAGTLQSLMYSQNAKGVRNEAHVNVEPEETQRRLDFPAGSPAADVSMGDFLDLQVVSSLAHRCLQERLADQSSELSRAHDTIDRLTRENSQLTMSNCQLRADQRSVADARVSELESLRASLSESRQMYTNLFSSLRSGESPSAPRSEGLCMAEEDLLSHRWERMESSAPSRSSRLPSSLSSQSLLIQSITSDLRLSSDPSDKLRRVEATLSLQSEVIERYEKRIAYLESSLRESQELYQRAVGCAGQGSLEMPLFAPIDGDSCELSPQSTIDLGKEEWAHQDLCLSSYEQSLQAMSAQYRSALESLREMTSELGAEKARARALEEKLLAWSRPRPAAPLSPASAASGSISTGSPGLSIVSAASGSPASLSPPSVELLSPAPLASSSIESSPRAPSASAEAETGTSSCVNYWHSRDSAENSLALSPDTSMSEAVESSPSSEVARLRSANACLEREVSSLRSDALRSSQESRSCLEGLRACLDDLSVQDEEMDALRLRLNESILSLTEKETTIQRLQSRSASAASVDSPGLREMRGHRSLLLELREKVDSLADLLASSRAPSSGDSAQRALLESVSQELASCLCELDRQDAALSSLQGSNRELVTSLVSLESRLESSECASEEVRRALESREGELRALRAHCTAQSEELDGYVSELEAKERELAAAASSSSREEDSLRACVRSLESELESRERALGAENALLRQELSAREAAARASSRSGSEVETLVRELRADLARRAVAPRSVESSPSKASVSAQYESELSSLSSYVERLERELEPVLRERASLQARVQSLEGALSSLRHELSASERALSSREEELRASESRSSSLERDLSELREKEKTHVSQGLELRSKMMKIDALLSARDSEMSAERATRACLESSLSFSRERVSSLERKSQRLAQLSKELSLSEECLRSEQDSLRRSNAVLLERLAASRAESSSLSLECSPLRASLSSLARDASVLGEALELSLSSLRSAESAHSSESSRLSSRVHGLESEVASLRAALSSSEEERARIRSSLDEELGVGATEAGASPALVRLRSVKRALEAQLSDLERRLSESQAEQRSSSSRCSELEAALSTSSSHCSELERALSSLEEARAALSISLSSERRAWSERLERERSDQSSQFELRLAQAASELSSLRGDVVALQREYCLLLSQRESAAVQRDELMLLMLPARAPVRALGAEEVCSASLPHVPPECSRSASLSAEAAEPVVVWSPVVGGEHSSLSLLESEASATASPSLHRRSTPGLNASLSSISDAEVIANLNDPISREFSGSASASVSIEASASSPRISLESEIRLLEARRSELEHACESLEQRRRQASARPVLSLTSCAALRCAGDLSRESIASSELASLRSSASRLERDRSDALAARDSAVRALTEAREALSEAREALASSQSSQRDKASEIESLWRELSSKSREAESQEEELAALRSRLREAESLSREERLSEASERASLASDVRRLSGRAASEERRSRAWCRALLLLRAESDLLVSELRARLSTAASSSQSLESSLSSVRRALSQREEELARAQSDLSAQQSQSASRQESYEARVQRLLSELSSSRSESASVASMASEYESEVSAFQRSLSDREAALHSQRAALDSSESAVRSLGERLGCCVSDLDSWQRECASLRAQLASREASQQAERAQSRALREELAAQQRLEGEAQRSLVELRGRASSSEASVQSLRSSLSARSEELRDLRATVTSLESALRRGEADLAVRSSELSASERTVSSLREELASLGARLAESTVAAESSSQRAESLEAQLLESQRDLESSLASLASMRRSSAEALSSLSESRSRLSEESSGLESRVRVLSSELEARARELSRQSSELSSARATSASLRTDLVEARSGLLLSESSLRSLASALESGRASETFLQSELASLRASEASLQKELASLRASEASLQSELASSRAIGDSLQRGLQSSRSALESELESVRSSHEALHPELVSLRASKDALESELETLRDKHASLEEEFRSTRTALESELETLWTAHEAQESELEASRASLASLASELKGLQSSSEAQRRALEEAVEERQRLVESSVQAEVELEWSRQEVESLRGRLGTEEEVCALSLPSSAPRTAEMDESMSSSDSSGIVHLTDSVLTLVDRLRAQDVVSGDLLRLIEGLSSCVLCLQSCRCWSGRIDELEDLSVSSVGGLSESGGRAIFSSSAPLSACLGVARCDQAAGVDVGAYERANAELRAPVEALRGAAPSTAPESASRLFRADYLGEIRSLMERVRALESDLLRATREGAAQASEQSAELRRRESELSSRLSALRASESLVSGLQRSQTQLASELASERSQGAASSARVRELGSALETLAQSLEREKASRAEAEAQLASLGAELRAALESLRGLSSERSALSDRVQTLEPSLASASRDLTSERARCQCLEASLGEQQEQQARLVSELQRLGAAESGQRGLLEQSESLLESERRAHAVAWEGARAAQAMESESLRARVARLEAELESLSGTHSSSSEEWSRAARSLRAELSSVSEERDGLQAQLAAQTARESALRASVSSLEERLRAQSSELQSEREARASEQRIRRSESEESSSRLSSLSSSLEEARAELRAREEELDSLRSSHERLESAQRALRSDLESSESSLLASRRQQGAAESSLRSLRSELSSAQASVQSLEAQLSGVRAELAGSRASLVSTEGALREALARSDAQEVKTESLRAQLEASKSSLASQRSESESSLSKLAQRHAALEQRLAEAEGRVVSLESERASALARQSELESTLGSESSARAQAESRESEMESLCASERARSASLELEASLLRASLASLESERRSRDASLSSLRALLEQSESTRVATQSSLESLESSLASERERSASDWASAEARLRSLGEQWESLLPGVLGALGALSGRCEAVTSSLASLRAGLTSSPSEPPASIAACACGCGAAVPSSHCRRETLAALCASLTSRLEENEREVSSLTAAESERASAAQTKDVLLGKYRSRLELQESQLERSARRQESLEEDLRAAREEKERLSSELLLLRSKRSESSEAAPSPSPSFRIRGLEAQTVSAERELLELRSSLAKQASELVALRQASAQWEAERSRLESRLSSVSSSSSSPAPSPSECARLREAVASLAARDQEVCVLRESLKALSSSSDSLRSRVASLESELARAESSSQEARASQDRLLSESETARAECERQLRRLESKVSLQESLNRGLESAVSSQLSTLESERASHASSLAAEARLREEAERRFESLKGLHASELQRGASLASSLSERERRVSELESSLSSSRASLESSERALSELRSLESSLKSQLGTQEGVRRRLESELASESAESARLSRCVEEWCERYGRRESEVQSLNGELSEHKERLGRLSELESALESTRASESALRSELAAIKGSESSLQARLKAKEESESSLLASLQGLQDSESILLAKLKTVQDSESALRTKLKALGASETALRSEGPILRARGPEVALATPPPPPPPSSPWRRECEALQPVLASLRAENTRLQQESALQQQKLVAQERLLALKEEYLTDVKAQKRSYQRRFQSALKSTHLPVSASGEALASSMRDSDHSPHASSLSSLGGPIACSALRSPSPPGSDHSPDPGSEAGEGRGGRVDGPSSSVRAQPRSILEMRRSEQSQQPQQQPRHQQLQQQAARPLSPSSGRSAGCSGERSSLTARPVNEAGAPSGARARVRAPPSISSPYTYIPSYRDSHPEVGEIRAGSRAPRREWGQSRVWLRWVPGRGPGAPPFAANPREASLMGND